MFQNTYVLPKAVKVAMESVEEAFSAMGRLGEAIELNRSSADSEAALLNQAIAERDVAEVALSLAVTEGDAKKLEAAVSASEAKISGLSANIERKHRIIEALLKRVPAAETAIGQADETLMYELGEHGEHLKAALLDELTSVARPLLAWMQKADSIAGVLPMLASRTTLERVFPEMAAVPRTNVFERFVINGQILRADGPIDRDDVKEVFDDFVAIAQLRFRVRTRPRIETSNNQPHAAASTS